MQDILSQQEIDSLLASLSAGDVSAESMKQEQKEKKIRTYDFRRPNRFSKEQVRTLEMLHENLARLLTTYFSAHLRTAVKVNLLSVEELSYTEFINSVLNPTVMMQVRVDDLDGEMLIEVNPSLAFGILERLLGGKGSGRDERRALTGIEQILILRVAGQILSVLADAWGHVAPFQANIERMESNPQFVQMLAGNEMVALVSLEITINGTQGYLNLSYPYPLLKPITSKFSARHWFSKSDRQELPLESSHALKKRLAKAQVPIVVELGRTTITTKELLNLQAGDVIPLDSLVTGETDIYIGDRPKLRGRPGLAGERLAVKITAIRKEGEAGE